MKRRRRRGISIGTVVMLALTLVVCLGVSTVMNRLGGEAAAIDADKIFGAFNLSDAVPDLSVDDMQAGSTRAPSTAAPTPVPSAAATVQPTAAPRGGTFSMTVGGSVCVETNVRQSGYYKDAKAYDFTEIFALAGREFDSDINMVTLENLIVPDSKVSDVNAPGEIVQMLSIAGVDTVALGWSKVYDKKYEGVSSTAEAVSGGGLRVVGVYPDEADTAIDRRIQTVGGVRVAILDYTEALSSTGAKALKKDGRTWVVPQTDAIAGDIAAAREAGADVVIVSVSWGTVGRASPTKAQKTLAQLIADAGADVILGTGPRVVQPAEWLTGTRADGSTHQVLCLYSLGTLISDERKDSRVAGMLLKMTVSVDARGNVTFPRLDYIPTYVWRFKQDSLYSYRVVAADLPAPDGMESSQQKSMQTACKTVAAALGEGVLTLRQP